jgi:hypothetical protein
MQKPKPTSILKRFYSQTDRFFTRLMIFTTGIFLSAIFFLFMLKTLGSWGIYLALGTSIILNIWLKKNRPKDFLLNSLNNGLITFNIITIISGLAIMIVFFGAAQSALN